MFLRHRRVDGSEADILHRKRIGTSDLADIVRGMSDDGIPSQQPAGSRRRQIVLSEVNSVSVSGEYQVRTVVNDYCDAALSRELDAADKVRQQQSHRRAFIADLD